MPDINASLQQLEGIFHRSTSLCLGYDIDNASPEIAAAQRKLAAEKIRLAWPVQGAPGWKVTEDLAFLKIATEYDDYTVQRNKILEHIDALQGRDITEFNNCLKVSWVFYGPNSYFRAMKVFINMYTEVIREDLKKNFIYPVPNAKLPVRAPELFSAQWWERVDLDMQFNALIQIGVNQPYFQSVHATVENEKGDESSVDVGY